MNEPQQPITINRPYERCDECGHATPHRKARDLSDTRIRPERCEECGAFFPWSTVATMARRDLNTRR